MSTCLYNGVELTDIDTVWIDKDTYKHAYVLSSTIFGANYHSYNSEYLLLTSAPISIVRRSSLYKDVFDCIACGLESDSTCKIIMYELVSDEWIQFKSGSYYNDTICYDILPIWCNTDIAFIEGFDLGRNTSIQPTISNEVYLTSSDPVYGKYDRYLYNGIKMANIYMAYNRYETIYSYTLLTNNSAYNTPIIYAFKERPKIVKENNADGPCVLTKLVGDSETIIFSGRPGDPGRILPSVELILNGEFSIGTFDIGWADFTIFNEDGSIYLEATDPILVNEDSMVLPEFDLNTWLTGYSLGLCTEYQFDISGNTSEEYLYNNVRLVKLPDFPRPTHPTLMITHNSYVYMYDSRANIEPESIRCKYPGYALIRWYDTGYNPYLGIVSSKGFLIADEFDLVSIYDESSHEWIKASEGPPVISFKHYIIDINKSDIIWTSRDIYNEDGTLYLPASRPIKVP